MIVAGKDRKFGWLRPEDRHKTVRSANLFADAVGVTPQEKGFFVSDEVPALDIVGPVLDQGQVGDCTANAGIESLRAARVAVGASPIDFSRYYLYARTRKNIAGGSLDEDSGATVTDMVLSMMHFGVCPEGNWPASKGWQADPDSEADTEAAFHKAIKCYALNTVEWVKACLSFGRPVVFGVMLPASFENIGPDGRMPLPVTGEAFLGGHCMIAIGYRKRVDGLVDFLVQNSWSTDWGMDGRCWMPQEYFETFLAEDMWTVHWELVA